MSIVAMSSTSVVNIDDGTGVVSVEVTYAIGTSPTTPPGNPMVDGGNVIVDINGVPMTNASWQTGIPTVPQGSYLWTRTVTTYTSGDFAISYAVGYTGSDGANGPRGISITDEKEQWYLSNSNSSLTGGSWSDTEPQEIPDGKYLWGRWAFTMSDGSTQYSDAVYRSVIGGVVNLTDEINKKISQKIWSTDIETSVQQYDASVTQTIRDRMSDVEQDLNGITSRVSAAESSLTTKADGSTVTALQNTVTQNKQTADAFQQTVTSTYAKLTDVADQIGSIKIGGNNLYVIADEVPGYLNGNNSGAIAVQQAANKEITSDYIPVKAGSNYIIQSWCTPSSAGQSWLAYQFFSDNDPVTPVGNRIAKYGKDSNSGVETTADGQERLMYDVQAPEGATLLRVSYRSFNDGYAMVECATKPSEYSINSRDIEQYTDDAVESAKSEIKQTTDSISLEVSKKVGSSEIISKINQSPETVTISASKIDLIGNVTFNMFDSDTQNALTSGSELIIGSQTAQTSAWTGKSTKLSAIGSGTRISYKLPYASTSTAVTLNLTLNNNTTTGAKEVYYLNNTRLNTQYSVNSIVELIYDGSAWRVINPYSDANTYDRTRYQQAIKAGATAITAGNIIVAGANNVGTYTHLKLGNAFDTTYPILYAGSNIAANSTGNNNYLIIPLGITTTQTGTYTAYKSVYIKGTLRGTTFTPVSTTPLTQTIPTSADNYHYMLLGTMYSTTEMYLLGEHPIFQYYKNSFMTTTQIAAEAATTAETANSTANTANTNASNAVSTANTANTNASNAVSTANTANTNAANAVSTANTANTNASNAVSTANTANTNASNAVSTANTAKSTADTAKSTADTATDMASKTLGMKVNYSDFNTANNGELYVHGYTNNAPAAVDGYVYWNGVKRNVPKGMINPNAILPYYKTILIVLRLSSAAAISGTLYLVWYNGGWKHSVTQPTAIAGDWSWSENTDIVLGQFIEPSNEGAIVDAYLYEPPRNASHVLTTGLNSYGYSQDAVTWVSNNGTNMTNALSMIKKWTNNAVSDTTTIQGGWIATNTITSQQLATNAIVSNNYIASTNLASPYSATGTFLDLSNGNFWTPNFGVINTTPDGSSVPVGAWFNGTVYASAGKFGTDTSYWNIETVYDYNNQPHASLVGVGDPYLQTGNWQVSNNAVATRKYTSTNETSGTATYYKDTDSNTFYDVGMKIPTNFGAYSNSDSSVVKYNKAFFYGRKYTGNNVPALDADWTYFFMIDASGNIFENGTKLSDKYASIDGVSGAYLPLTGGTISGNLTVNGTLTAVASKATQLNISRNLNVNLGLTTNSGKIAFNGSSDVTLGVTGTLGVGNGGTGKSSWTQYGIVYATATNALGQMAVGTSGQVLTSKGSAAPAWTSQSELSVGSATKATQDSDGNAINTTYRKLSNTDFTELSTGNLVVTGAATFTNGLNGDLIGNANTATTAATADKVCSNLVILLNSGTTEGTNKFTYNGSATKNVNITKSGIGLGNVDNTADANKTVKEAGKVTNTLKIQLNGGTTEGTNQFSYDGSAAKNINITKSSVGLGSVENTALSTWGGSANLTTTKVGTLAVAATKGVDTSISASSTSANLPTSAAVAMFVEGKGYVTSSGVTSVRIQATNPVVSSVNTAQSSTLNTTISLADGYGDTKNPYGTKTKNYVLAGPTTGSAAAPTFRALVADDIPTLTPGKAGLGNVTNNKQVKGLSSGTTSGHLVSWGADGYTVADSGVAVSSVNKTVKSLASNNDGKIVLTYLDGTTSDPIEVKIIGSSGSSVSYADALNVNGTAVGGAEQPVFINNQGKPQTANKIPKLNNGTTGGTFYAPTVAGTSGQVLTSSGGTPSWTNQSSLSVGTATNVSASAGTTNHNRHVWFSDDTTETKRVYDDDFQYNPSTNTLTVANVSGNASSATKLTTSAGDWSVPVYFSDGKPVATTYLNLHPENANSMIIPFFNNDWAYLIERGGAYEIYSTTATSFTSTSINKTAISVDLTNAFDASYTYIGVNRPQTETTVIDITCPATHTYANTFYIDFGSSSWRANSIQVLAYNTATESEYVSKGSITNNTLGHWKLKFSHSSTNTSGTTVQGFNRVRIVLSGWANTQNRIAQIGLVNYGSFGQRITYMSRGIDDGVYRSISPAKDNHYNLGSSSYKWANVYATTFSGNATSATKATQDSDGAVISSTYAKRSGATFTGAINTANNTWNTIGDDAYLGDINKGGHIGIKGKNGNTGLFFVTYNQNSNTTGGAITWDGTKFSISGTVDTSISGNAATATTATTANSIKNLGRKENLDIDNTDNQYKNKVTYMLAASSTTTGKPPIDSGVLNFAWDGNRWGAQLAIKIDTTPHMYIRGNNNSDWDASWLTVLDSNNFNTYAPKKDGTGATGTWGISISGTATKATQDSDGNAINTTYMKKSGGAFTGAVTGTSFAASSYIAVNSGNSGTAGGLALWSTDPTAYGIMLRTTANQGKHGYVQGEYAAYLTMSGATASAAETRGWVFKNKMANECVTSISALGHAVFNGSVTVGGNATNTSGCRQEFDVDLQCLNFIFN